MSDKKTIDIYQWCLLAGVILLSIYGIWRHMDYRLYVEDDLVWFYEMSVNIPVDKDMVDYMENEYLQYLEQNTTDGQWPLRASIRFGLDEQKNYLAGNLIVLFASHLVRSFGSFDLEKDYPSYVTTSFMAGFMLQTVLVTILAFGIIFFVSDRKMMTAFVLALIYILVSDYFSSEVRHDFVSQSAIANGLGYILGNFFQMLFAPIMAFSPFYPPFKSRLVLLVLAAFFLRWREFPAWSYWLLFLGAFFHQGYGGIAILFVLAIDIIKRPDLFKNVKVLIPSSLGALTFFARDETFREALGAFPPMLLFVFLTVLAAGIFGLRKYLLLMREKVYVPIGKKMGDDPIRTDVFLFSCLWLGSILLFIPISLHVDLASSNQFWGLVHGRMLGVFHPVLIVFACREALFILSRFVQEKTMLLVPVVVLICALGFFYVHAFKNFETPGETYAELREDFNKLENLSQTTLGPFGGLDRSSILKMTQGEVTESLVFYTMAKSKETGKNYYDILFGGQ